jgi:hypothetical protein
MATDDPYPAWRGQDTSRYASWPNHPLAGIRQSVLEDAHRVLLDAVDCKDVAPGMAEPIADAVVMKLLPWLKPEAFLTPEE